VPSRPFSLTIMIMDATCSKGTPTEKWGQTDTAQGIRCQSSSCLAVAADTPSCEKVRLVNTANESCVIDLRLELIPTPSSVRASQHPSWRDPGCSIFPLLVLGGGIPDLGPGNASSPEFPPTTPKSQYELASVFRSLRKHGRSRAYHGPQTPSACHCNQASGDVNALGQRRSQLAGKYRHNRSTSENRDSANTPAGAARPSNMGKHCSRRDHPLRRQIHM